ncbi:MAG TPA: hypothetical protein EYM34_02735, partial [Alphaproteobacteria bacterium]|nr:hypothetical protein [Alphaproteobacteria bacterium]
MTRLSILLIVITALLLAPPSGVWAARDCAGPGINHQPETYGASDVLSMIAYNVYLLPISARDIPFMGNNFAKAQEERAALIAPFLKPFDVVILSEAYDDDAREILLEGLRREGFLYSTHILASAYRDEDSDSTNRVLIQAPPLHACAGDEDCGFGQAGEGDSGVDQDGGVIILARHPITEARERVYSDCEGRDYHALKGFVYAAIEKGGKRYHVIATHAQFGWQPEQSAAKRKQFGQTRGFAARISGNAAREPVIIGGDFNMLRHEFHELEDEALLGAVAPQFLGHPYTRETRNDWVDRGNGYVDYIFAYKGARAPAYSSNCPLVFRTRYDFEDGTLFSPSPARTSATSPTTSPSGAISILAAHRRT